MFGEVMPRDYNKLYGMDFAALRFPHVYGPVVKGTAVWKDLSNILQEASTTFSPAAATTN